jgi:hypothetical protein
LTSKVTTHIKTTLIGGSEYMPFLINVFKLALVLLIFMSDSAYAKSVSETAKEFYDLLKKENYSAAAEYYEPAALSEFRELMSFENEIPDGMRKIYYQTFFTPALTDDSVSNLSDLDFFASFWRGILTSESFTGSETFSGATKYDDVEILGVVMEGENLAHVVIRNRTSIAKHNVESVEVTTFGKIGSQWKLKLSGKVKIIALTLRWSLTH